MKISVLLLGNLLAVACAAGTSNEGKKSTPLMVPTELSSKKSIPANESAVHGYPTLEALVEEAISKLNAKDTATLTRMAFGREEFIQAYPYFESDTSRMRRDFACDYYLADNRKLLSRRLDQVGGKSLEVERIEVSGNRMENQAFVLTQGLKIWVRDGEKVYELSFLKSAVKTDSGWKIWSFEDS